jgi:prolyl-tRNA editing enzyme YbaK/EbsC (Cys-tRNA(Pro) deacylase)
VKPASSASARKVQAILGDGFQVLEFDESTRTAADAAAAIGCTVGQIAKSLIFRATESGRPVLAIASGSVRVDERRLSSLLGEDIARADAAFVREHTGFAIGGVPPVGHRSPPVIFIDETLLGFETIWAAGGTPNAVFRLQPDDLVRLTGGQVAAIARQARRV